MKAMEIFYEGRVQGVGFRGSVKQIARGFDVSGRVENLPDGRVALQVRGEADEVDAFLSEIQDSHLRVHIQKTEARVISGLEDLRGFSIIA